MDGGEEAVETGEEGEREEEEERTIVLMAKSVRLTHNRITVSKTASFCQRKAIIKVAKNSVENQASFSLLSTCFVSSLSWFAAVCVVFSSFFFLPLVIFFCAFLFLPCWAYFLLSSRCCFLPVSRFLTPLCFSVTCCEILHLRVLLHRTEQSYRIMIEVMLSFLSSFLSGSLLLLFSFCLCFFLFVQCCTRDLIHVG